MTEFRFQLCHFVGRSLVSYLNFSSFVILSVKNVIMIESSSWGFCEVYLGADLGDLPEEAAAAAKLHQSCPTLCDPIDSNPPGSPVPGILQARTLEWVAISFFNAWKWKVKVRSLSSARLLGTPWTVAHQAPPSMGFSRQEYWSGVPLPSPPEEAS